eukprot:m.139079 g.139079  ORF g.139079 m.139079 type:complete len:605 (+) comp17049_c0_seq1:291-2105(+)
MSKFRARALEPSKPLPIYRSTEDPNVLLETSQVARSVPQMPTGMEKEEEEEHHIKEAITAQGAGSTMVIPTPAANIAVPHYEELTPLGYKLPKQYIRLQLFGLAAEEEPPDFDMDTEDEGFLDQLNQKTEPKLKPLQFERAMDNIEKHRPIRETELASTLQTEEEVAKKIYAYYQDKIKKLGREFIMPKLKPDQGDAASSRDPYVAFRRRVEKMQTRKNRKNDETGFVNMLKLRRDLERVRGIIDLLKTRETHKRQMVELEADVLRQRYALGDWDGQLLRAVTPLPVQPRSTSHGVDDPLQHKREQALQHKLAKQKAAAKHKKLKRQQLLLQQQQQQADDQHASNRPRIRLKVPLQPKSQNQPDDEDEWEYDDTSAATEPEYQTDGPIRFRRRAHVKYHAPLEEPALCFSRAGLYQPISSPTATTPRRREVSARGFFRRRIGRGGRVFIDRCSHNLDWFDELAPMTMEQIEDEREFFVQEGLVPKPGVGRGPAGVGVAAVGLAGGTGGAPGTPSAANAGAVGQHALQQQQQQQLLQQQQMQQRMLLQQHHQQQQEQLLLQQKQQQTQRQPSGFPPAGEAFDTANQKAMARATAVGGGRAVPGAS